KGTGPLFSSPVCPYGCLALNLTGRVPLSNNPCLKRCCLPPFSAARGYLPLVRQGIRALLFPTLQAGARATLKDVRREELSEMIREAVLHPRIATRVMQQMREGRSTSH